MVLPKLIIISLLLTLVEAGAEYVGCFREQNSDTAMPGYQETDAYQSVFKCVILCRGKGFLYAGLKLSTRCFCSHWYAKYGQAREEDCNIMCPGNSQQKCGGIMANSVWTTDLGHCMQPMGMTSGTIEDFQITASSSEAGFSPENGRLSSTGWCALLNDTKPYLQVDFLSDNNNVNCIQGVRLQAVQQWQETTCNATKCSQRTSMFRGPTVFYVQYGTNLTQLSNYTEDYKLWDKTIFSTGGILYEQTDFMFKECLNGRYLRLRFLRYHNDGMCAKLEVIGCNVKSALLHSCEDSDSCFTPYVVTKYRHQALLPLFEFTMLGDVDSGLSCAAKCQKLKSCDAALENPIQNICLIHGNQKTTGYGPFTLVPLTSTQRWIIHQRICLNEDIVFHEKIIRTQINTQEVITSPGFPYYTYGEDFISTWEINFSDNLYIDLLFQHIKLRKRQESCQDNITISTPGGGQSKPLQENNTISVEVLVVTSAMNGREFRYLTRLSAANMIFTSCPISSIVQDREGGFRIFVLSSAYPAARSGTTILPSDMYGLLLTPTYLEPETDTRNVEWHLGMKNGPGMYLSLEFRDFDISCNDLTGFHISDSNIVTSYCNLQKPWNIFNSESNYVGLFLHIGHNYEHAKYVTDVGKVQGFEILFQRLFYKQYMAGLASVNDDTHVPKTHELSNNGNFRYLKVCSDHLLSCYLFAEGLLSSASEKATPKSLTWYEAEQVCVNKTRGHLVSIQSQKELDFVRYNVHTGLQKNQTIDGNNRMYIGFRKMNHGQFQWTDNGAVVFTAWAQHEPRILVAKEACAVMDLSSLKAEHVWKIIDCEEEGATMFVCEQKYETSRIPNITYQYEVPGDELQEELENSNWMKCKSGEYVSRLFECDKELDCSSGDDEQNCDVSDEAGVNTGSPGCSIDEFQCDDKECIPFILYCDFIPNCNDGSDEMCEFPECEDYGWRCSNGECLYSYNMRCDGVIDCYDKSDELQCDPCSPDSFRCEYTCIPMAKVCDGVQDCNNIVGGDEDQDCYPAAMGSCEEWYIAGYRDNNTFMIKYGESTFQVECYFRKKTLTVEITTVIPADIDTRFYINNYGYSITYSSLEFIKNIEDSCSPGQEVVQSCYPWIERLHSADVNYKDPHCLCIIANGSKSRLTYDPCDGNMQVNRTALQQTFVFNITFGMSDVPVNEIDSAGYNKLHMRALRESYATIRRRRQASYFSPFFNDSLVRLKRVNFVCRNEILAPKNIPCRKGKPVEGKYLCLYNEGLKGERLGCQDGSNLLNCETFTCPNGYTKCPNSYCIASTFLCDGINHCPNGEDEINCDEYRKCPQQLRCKGLAKCVSAAKICNGNIDCPAGEDEKFCSCLPGEDQTSCETTCLRNCICDESVIRCEGSMLDLNFDYAANLSVDPRVLILKSSMLSTAYLKMEFPFLAYLEITKTSLRSIPDGYFAMLRNVLDLVIRQTNIEFLRYGMFRGLVRVRRIDLSYNSELHSIGPNTFQDTPMVMELLLVETNIDVLRSDTFNGLKKIRLLNLAGSGISVLEVGALRGLNSLENLDLTNNEIKTFASNVFLNLDALELISTDTHLLCCAMPSPLSREKCTAKATNELSSCDDLIRSSVLRVIVWIVCLLTLAANGFSFGYKLIYEREKMKRSYNFFVSNLIVADFLMGVYLLIIAVKDILYKGEYYTHEEEWQKGAFCTFTGIVANVSTEVSVFVICLITLDRYLAVTRPMQKYFTFQRAIISAANVWIVSLLLALLPLMVPSYEEFYSKTSVCLALPLTESRPPGWEYSFIISVVLNFALFIFIAVGQMGILIETTAAQRRISSNQERRNKTLARRLLLVAATDFICHVPVETLGMLAASGKGHLVTGDVYAYIAVLVLPINSAVNPFLYTISTIRKNMKDRTVRRDRQQVPNIRADLEKLTSADRAKFHIAKIWKCKSLVNIRQPKRDGNIQILNSKELTLLEAVFVAYKVATSLYFLHQRHLYADDLTLQSLYGVKNEDDKLIDVLILLKDVLVVSDYESKAMEDINSFAKFLKQIPRVNEGRSNYNASRPFL